MKVFKDSLELREALNAQNDQTVGLVPTMGALHEGHAALLKCARQQNGLLVATIFVNPLQFNDPNDYKNYPIKWDDDLALLEREGVDVLYAPDPDVFYANHPVTQFDFGYLEEVMEGKHRPNHFKGVAMVVARLFNIISPHRAYFGQKDRQQLAIIKHLARDLAFGIEIVPVPTVREADGLAMSSRNTRLTEDGRNLAPVFYKALQSGKDHLLSGKTITDTMTEVRKFVSNYPSIKLEYFDIVDSMDLVPVDGLEEDKELVLCIAGFVDGVRLIDNITVKK